MSSSIREAVPTSPVPLEAGDRMPERSIGPITRTHIVRYAGAGGDMNPIHHDEEFARGAGMSTVFAMGLMHGGMLSYAAGRWLGPGNVRSLALRFTGQVWPGDVLTLTGEVERVEEDAGERLAHCALRVTRQTGDDALRATAVAVVA